MAVTSPSSTESTDRAVTVLLVDDQAIVGESIRRMLADQSDIAFHFCQEPSKAIATANEVHPTVILQDLVMPDVDGLQLVKFFRVNKATRETPMIVLSSKEDPAIKAQAFALGANDYLVKWPDKLEILARIRYHSRGYINLLERNEAYQQLAESQRQLAEEVAQAARYVRSLLPTPLAGNPAIEWRFVPSTQLGGDMFGYHWLDDNRLAIYLLDVSGHGVGSSLLAVSASNLLAAHSLPGGGFRRSRPGPRPAERYLPNGPPERKILHDVVWRVSPRRALYHVQQRRPPRRRSFSLVRMQRARSCMNSPRGAWPLGCGRGRSSIMRPSRWERSPGCSSIAMEFTRSRRPMARCGVSRSSSNISQHWGPKPETRWINFLPM